MKLPLVSILMAVYNNPSDTRLALQSILDQTLTDFELIIIDDGSENETKLLLEAYAAVDNRIVLVHNESNIGLTRSLNKALTLANGTYIARQDADDISKPQRLEKQIAYLESHSGVGLLGTAYTVIDNEGTMITVHQQPHTDTEIRWQMLFHNAFCHTSVIFRYALLKRHQLKYDEEKPLSQDYDLWGKVLFYTEGANLQEDLVHVRKHDKSVSATRQESQQLLATRIAERQMRQVWSDHPFSLSEISKLRQWYNRFPQRLTKQDMILCRYLLQLIARFGQQPNVDSSIVEKINLRWTRHILNAVFRLDQWADLVSSGLLKTLLRYNLSEVLIIMSTLPNRKVRRRRRSLPKANAQEE